ncbi:Phosphorelay intermediate protein [Emydomyces testavorans]|uniref:Phosphorelay intermediate protein n=1 Tax=Emydomyces testavorans TaxID=2070801 RepID=A0AAF0DMC0_9EURO|nr:Phosphorelay intermediate protein [Emydomyces testavorans]
MAPSATPTADESLKQDPQADLYFLHSQTDELGINLNGREDLLDRTTFDQILEMDDDNAREFSKGIVYGFFDQAEATFVKMENAIVAQDLSEVSQLGHFLKGSSATLGLTKVKDACEKIQNFGARKDESGIVDEPDKAKSLSNIKKTLTEVKEDYNEVAKLLRDFYGDTIST